MIFEGTKKSIFFWSGVDTSRVVSPLNYKEAIVEIVGKIHSERILKRIYKFVLYLYTHETGS